MASRGWKGLITYLLTPWSRVLLEKITVLQLVKKFPAFCGTNVTVYIIIPVKFYNFFKPQY